MKTSWLHFTIILTICLFFSINPLRAQENISWLKNFTNDITVAPNTFSYSFKTVDNNSCKISIEEKKTDKKGVITTMIYQLYLSDLNTSAINFKTSGSTVTINMEIKQSQKFIRVYKNGELDEYTEKVSITMNEVDMARSFIEAMKSNIANCQSSERKWTSRDETMKWMTQNIGKSESSGTVYEQSFKAGEKSYLASLESVSTDSKGVKQSMTCDFNLNDINSTKINMVVSGKTFHIVLPARENNYYIRLKKGTGEISYVKELGIYSDDLEQARNILNGLVYLVSETPAPERKAWNSYNAALGFVKENVSEVKNGTSTIGQSFSFDASPSGIAQFITSKTDSKGIAAKNYTSFYLIDLQPSVNLEVTSKSITLNLSTKDKNKYIKESNDNSTLAYSGFAEIVVTDLENARELAHALEYAIGKSEKGLQEFSTLDKAINWITSNVTEVKIDVETINQTLKVITDNENKIELKAVTTGEKSTSIVEDFEIYPEDLKVDDLKIKVSGKKLAVDLSTGKFKYIKYFKDNVLQNYSANAEILFDDVLKAKNFITAISMLRNKSQVADRSMNDKASAWRYIMENTKKMEVAGESLDQKMEQRDGDNCKGRFTRTETNSKGVSVENIYEFIVSDIDAKYSEIAISSKSLKVTLVTKGKEKLIKPYKNGESGNFINSVDIDADNVLVAKKLIAAFGSLAGLCK
jgi:hypothetical protein